MTARWRTLRNAIIATTIPLVVLAPGVATAGDRGADGDPTDLEHAPQDEHGEHGEHGDDQGDVRSPEEDAEPAEETRGDGARADGGRADDDRHHDRRRWADGDRRADWRWRPAFVWRPGGPDRSSADDRRADDDHAATGEDAAEPDTKADEDPARAADESAIEPGAADEPAADDRSASHDAAADDAASGDAAADGVAADDVAAEPADARPGPARDAEADHAVRPGRPDAGDADRAPDRDDREQRSRFDDDAPTERGTQETQLVAVALARSDTGDNVAVGSGAGSADLATAAGIVTGAAAARGSVDQTTVTQDAIVQLADDSTAEIIQITLVLNIGAAIANTGGNAVGGSGGSGASGTIDTGSSLAIGNASQVAVMQGATADAADGALDAVEQGVVTVQIGVATSSTGSNTIIATVAAGGPAAGSVATGGATAIGNQSSSTVDQTATANASGSSNVTIEQRATIVNLGVALANTGANEVGILIDSILALPDDEVAAQLLGLVLPALLAEGAFGAAGGANISTGDATAIGNQSATTVEQIAVAVAEQGGDARIEQDTLVVNAGLAVADTGQNGVASAMDAAVDDAVAQLSADFSSFIAAFLADIDAWAAGEQTEVASTSLSRAIGDQILEVTGDVDTSTEVRETDGGSAIIRQLTAVIDMAIAVANTGQNVLQQTVATSQSVTGPSPQTALTEDVGTLSAASTVTSSSGVSIVTGDAEAVNRFSIVICQRDDAAEMACPTLPDPIEEPPPDTDGGVRAAPTALLPEPEPVSVAADPVVAPAMAPSGAAAVPVARSAPAGPVPAPAATLPATGSSIHVILLTAWVSLLLGGALVGTSRRRERT